MKNFALVFIALVLSLSSLSGTATTKRTEIAVVNDCDGYRNILETPDGHQWIIDGYDLRVRGLVLLTFDTLNTEIVYDDIIIDLIEID